MPKNICYSPDGKCIACNIVSAVQIYTIASCNLPKAVGNGPVKLISWSPNSKYIAYCTEANNIIELWDTTTCELVTVLTNAYEIVTDLKYSPDGNYIAASSYDNAIHIWNAATYEHLFLLQSKDSIGSISWSPDSKYLASTDSQRSTIDIWDIETKEKEQLTTTIGTNCVVSWSPNGKYIASIEADTAIKIWDIEANSCIGELKKIGFTINTFCWSPDSKYIASSETYVRTCSSNFCVWYIPLCWCINKIELKGTDRVQAISWEPCGDHVAYCQYHDYINRIDVAIYKAIAAHTFTLKQVALLLFIYKQITQSIHRNTKITLTQEQENIFKELPETLQKDLKLFYID